MKRLPLILVFCLLLCAGELCARNVRIYGYVVDSDNRGIELANVVAIEEVGLRTQDERQNSSDFKEVRSPDRTMEVPCSNTTR